MQKVFPLNLTGFNAMGKHAITIQLAKCDNHLQTVTVSFCTTDAFGILRKADHQSSCHQLINWFASSILAAAISLCAMTASLATVSAAPSPSISFQLLAL
ncbi:unnamed protein product [Rhodiola kirilowii]